MVTITNACEQAVAVQAAYDRRHEVLRRRAQGRTFAQIGQEFGVSPQRASAICREATREMLGMRIADAPPGD